MLMTSQQYEESLRKLEPCVYMFAKRLVKKWWIIPFAWPSLNAVAKHIKWPIILN